MEWKDKGAEAVYVGLIAFLGSWLLKLAKKHFIPVKTNIKNLWKVGEVEKDANYSKELILAVIHFSDYPMFLMDMKGDLKEVNSAWLDAMGFNDPQEAYDMGWLRAIPDIHIDLMLKRNKQFVEKASSFVGVIHFQNVETGVEFKANCRTVLLRDKSEKPIMSLGILKIIN